MQRLEVLPIPKLLVYVDRIRETRMELPWTIIILVAPVQSSMPDTTVRQRLDSTSMSGIRMVLIVTRLNVISPSIAPL